MARSMGVKKRAPQMSAEFLRDYAAISKAGWADLYFDLYRETHEETCGDAEIILDIRLRLEILKRYR